MIYSVSSNSHLKFRFLKKFPVQHSSIVEQFDDEHFDDDGMKSSYQNLHWSDKPILINYHQFYLQFNY